MPGSQMDLMPTLLEAVGKPIPKNLDLDGVSLLCQLRGKCKEQPHEFLFHHCGTDIFAMRWIKTDGKVFFFNFPSSLSIFIFKIVICRF